MDPLASELAEFQNNPKNRPYSAWLPESISGIMRMFSYLFQADLRGAWGLIFKGTYDAFFSESE
ncbi:MAG TPA: hypothetical protein PLI34_09590 [Saprospiraceae bacterium]|nr:hypothetical protein [Saprospiraceae bacterium]